MIMLEFPVYFNGSLIGFFTFFPWQLLMNLKSQCMNFQRYRYAFALLFSREVFILLIYMAVSASVLDTFMQTRSLREGGAEFGFSKMLDGSADRPYVYRQLVPIIANYAASLVSPEEQSALVALYLDPYHLKQLYFEKSKYHMKDTIEVWTPGYAIKYHMVYFILFLSLLGTLYCLRALIPTVSANENPLTPFVPVLFILLLPLSFMHGNYYYDFVEILLLSLLLLTAIKGYYAWWMLLLPLAVLNKESNILVPVLYAAVMIGNCSRWRSRIYIAIGFIVSVAVYIFIKHKFSQNPGGGVMWQFGKNIGFWLNPESYLLWHDFYAPMILFPRGFNIILLAVLAGLLFWQWGNKPLFTKRLFIVAMLINIPLFLLFCWQDEMRNLSFLYLPVYLLIVHTLLTPEFGRMSTHYLKP
jgi:hypothetical protein